MRSQLSLPVFTACVLVASSVVQAQNYPTRTVRYIVPQAPGGSSDTLARVVAPRLASALGQQVIVAPANVPQEVVSRLNREVVQIINSAEVKRVLTEQGYEPVGSTAEEFTSFTKTEIARWTKVTTAAELRTN